MAMQSKEQIGALRLIWILEVRALEYGASFVIHANAWSQLYTNKLPVIAVRLLNSDVLSAFEQHKATITTILSDNRLAFCGRADYHHYEPFLQLEGIEYRTTKVWRPQSHGFAERPHKTLLDEHAARYLWKGYLRLKKRLRKPRKRITHQRRVCQVITITFQPV